MDPVYLTIKDYKKIKDKKINEGKDGAIYRVQNQILYKIYHETMPTENVLERKELLDAEGVKIYQKGDMKTFFPVTEGLEKFVRFRAEDMIFFAMQKQKEIELSTLPLAPLYIENRFKGCVIKDFKRSSSIYITQKLPMAIRLKIAKRLLKKVKELTDHYIYPRDLGGKPYSKSNALLTFLIEPELIDLDGRSCYYAEEEIPLFLKETLFSVQVLLLEILFSIPLFEIYTPEEKLEFMYHLQEQRIPDYYIDAFLSKSFTYEDWEEFFLVLKKL